MDYGKLEEYRQALRDFRNAENYFNVCEPGFIAYAIFNLCYAENRVSEILKEIRYEELDTSISHNKKSR